MFENKAVANIFSKKWPLANCLLSTGHLSFWLHRWFKQELCLGALNLIWPYPKFDSFWQLSHTATFKRQYETLIKEFEEMLEIVPGTYFFLQIPLFLNVWIITSFLCPISSAHFLTVFFKSWDLKNHNQQQQKNTAQTIFFFNTFNHNFSC